MELEADIMYIVGIIKDADAVEVIHLFTIIIIIIIMIKNWTIKWRKKFWVIAIWLWYSHIGFTQ